VRVRGGKPLDKLINFQLLMRHFCARGWLVMEQNIVLEFVICYKGVNVQ
jgi:hypothetical protein